MSFFRDVPSRVTPEQFERLVEQHGYTVIWEKAATCPCVDKGGVVKSGCALCFGEGFFYFDPKEIKVLISGFEGRKGGNDIAMLGDWALGSANLTSSSCNRISFRDRIRVCEAEVTYSDLQMMDDDKLKLRYEPLSLLLVRSETTVFTEGTDFNVAGDTLDFAISASPPLDDEYVTAVYTTNPVYKAMDSAHTIRVFRKGATNDPVEMPLHTYIRLEWMGANDD